MSVWGRVRHNLLLEGHTSRAASKQLGLWLLVVRGLSCKTCASQVLSPLHGTCRTQGCSADCPEPLLLLAIDACILLHQLRKHRYTFVSQNRCCKKWVIKMWAMWLFLTRIWLKGVSSSGILHSLVHESTESETSWFNWCDEWCFPKWHRGKSGYS
jgi:hypothetical protein